VPSDAPTRALTLDEAIDCAILLQKNEQLEEAGEVYRRVLEAAPDHARALHYAGVLAHQHGRTDEAIALLEKSLALVPDQADGYSNLGVVLQAAGQLELAAAAYQRAIAIDPSHANAYGNLGVVLRTTGRPSEAETAYRTAIRLNPRHIDAYTNLGILLNALKRTEEAARCFCTVITLRPRHQEARKLLALAYCTLGETSEAVKVYREWLAAEPADPVALHMLAACTGRQVPLRASEAFIERTFDSFASSFESKLERLSYRAPVLVAEMLEDAGVQRAKHLDVLDAGCGTGLCGPLITGYARRLVGVDLSEGMLNRAHEKEVYDELIRTELTKYLRENSGAFDIIVSADTLVYFGDLGEVIAVGAAALRANGHLVFTLERAPEGEVAVGYRLQSHGRYNHDRSYVEQSLRAAGLQAKIIYADLRTEAGAPVRGLVVRATR
jgi:predicted TPR repeat methyltransferase